MVFNVPSFYSFSQLQPLLLYNLDEADFLKYEGVLISPKPDLLPDVIGRNQQCHWKEGSVHVPNCKSFLLQRLKGSMSGDTRDFNNMET